MESRRPENQVIALRVSVHRVESPAFNAQHYRVVANDDMRAASRVVEMSSFVADPALGRAKPVVARNTKRPWSVAIRANVGTTASS